MERCRAASSAPLLPLQTGAGKTNVAMLAVCRELLQHVQQPGSLNVRKDEFKIVYVAPMKALGEGQFG